MKKRTYTVKQVAAALGVSTNTVYKYLEEGKIRATRLGREGRFRIPQSEVTRLLGIHESDIPQQASTSFQQAPQNPPSLLSPKTVIELTAKLNMPSMIHLFDCFVAVLGIFIGLSQLIFPPLTINPLQSTQLEYIRLIKVSLIPLGFAFFSLNIFLKRGLAHSLFHIMYAALLALVSFLFFQTGYYFGTIGYLSISILLIFSVVWQLSDIRKFLLNVYFVAYSVGIVILLHPESFGIEFFSAWLLKHNEMAALVWFVVISLALLVALFAARKRQISRISVVILGLVSFSLAFFSFSSKQWDQTVYASVLGSFILFLPWWQRCQGVAHFPRKEFLKEFLTFILILLLGAGLSFYIEKTARQDLTRELDTQVDKAAVIVANYIENSKATIKSYQQNEQLQSLLTDKRTDTESLQTKMKELYITSRTFRRIFLLNETGKVIAYYPYQEGSLGIDLSDRSYFKQTKDIDAVFVSEMIKLKVASIPPSIAVAARIMSQKGQYLGVIAGSLDFQDLENKLNQFKVHEESSFTIADQKKHILLHPNKQLILSPVSPTSPLLAAVDGKTGYQEKYTDLGTLSGQAYTPIESLHWGIVKELPLEAALDADIITAFSIFLTCIFSSIGSYLVMLYFAQKAHGT